jgi:hypothetical protein
MSFLNGVLNTLTGGKSDQASGDLEQALQAIQGVQTPTAQEMQYKVQQLVSAGVLTPEQAQTFLQSPNALASENVDQTGTQAQQDVIGSLLADAQAGGLNPEEQAQMSQIEQQLGTQEKGANDAVVQNQAARGALTGGETLAAQLQNNQNATVNANQNASNTAAQAYQQMLNELTSAGSLGAGLQSQENTQANTVASATNAINQFNTADQQQEENLNTQAKNIAQEENLSNAQNISNTNAANNNAYSAYAAQLPQEVYQDQLGKAEGEAGINEQQANQATGQGNQLLGLEGGLVNLLAPQPFTGQSAGSTIGGAGASSAPYAAGGASGAETGAGDFGFQGAGGGELGTLSTAGSTDMGGAAALSLMDEGGEVTGQAEVAGDSPRNDKVPALLSPREMVIPRSASIPAMHGDNSKVMDFLNRMRAKKQMAPPPVHPHDIKGVLDALTMRRGGHQ